MGRGGRRKATVSSKPMKKIAEGDEKGSQY
jgi:hypothetical protein